MSLNESPRGSRLHIALFGRRNAGKSSLINALAKQDIAVVSPVKGTTTDPVYKSMELLPLGPVVLIDTAGLDDEGELGGQRKKKTLEVLNKTDIALLVIDAYSGVTSFDKEIAGLIQSKNIPVIGVLNKTDLLTRTDESNRKDLVELVKISQELLGFQVIPVSAAEQQGVSMLRKALTTAVPEEDDRFRIVGDLLTPGDLVVLVVPIDKAAPKGRLILPQQQTIRDILESDAIAVVTKEHELKQTLESLGRKPRLVITDSQVFLKVAADTPKDIPLTSFSILFARHKGDLEELVRGARAIDRLEDGDKVLIAEPCTHHTQPDDIGSVKLPRWIRQATGRNIEFHHANGMSFPEDVNDYALIVHCGGCMINRRQMLWRMEQAALKGVPIVNYGVAIAHVQGILERAISAFPLARLAWEEEEAGKPVIN
ncbi:[FeFe] hydrogenase H-cluster maturation GTPase HydF [Paenibacillus tianjinensis]|uniref:[FeFe] hydrogenase H-cluster maturation GTPase HydF n=1 Tax=Paenibacillus tianjinensis TaxID=2810347 RepID=A0ABX7LNF0_9BACL|nr:[FeFe] hydrogenase H-cluster maturation GTPase HydF [Paenibacillus tianjinensis]QSF47372.1 [FeFe] hydrogenase H-cluster maturation GTPase HydF [Paenibacillus tianjinensis]